MAHKYTDFDSAYAAFAARFANAKQQKDNALTNAQAAYSGASDPVDKTHFGFLCYAVECLCNTFNHLARLNDTAYDQSYLYEAIYWAGQSGGGDPYVLTMDKILEAMWDTDRLRSFHFINYIDAMRAGIWNTEIYETHLQEWYRHFSL